MKWRMEPEAARKLADGLAAAIVVSIPWSTSAAYILMLVWAIGIGYFVWGDVPTLGLLVGSAIVVGSGLLLLWHEAKQKHRG